MSISRQMDKPKVVYTYNDYSAMKRNEILTYAATFMCIIRIMLSEMSVQMSFRHIMLSEIKQTQRDE